MLIEGQRVKKNYLATITLFMAFSFAFPGARALFSFYREKSPLESLEMSSGAMLGHMLLSLSGKKENEQEIRFRPMVVVSSVEVEKKVYLNQEISLGLFKPLSLRLKKKLNEHELYLIFFNYRSGKFFLFQGELGLYEFKMKNTLIMLSSLASRREEMNLKAFNEKLFSLFNDRFSATLIKQKSDFTSPPFEEYRPPLWPTMREEQKDASLLQDHQRVQSFLPLFILTLLGIIAAMRTR